MQNRGVRAVEISSRFANAAADFGYQRKCGRGKKEFGAKRIENGTRSETGQSHRLEEHCGRTRTRAKGGRRARRVQQYCRGYIVMCPAACPRNNRPADLMVYEVPISKQLIRAR